MKCVCQRVHTALYERVRSLRILATDLQSDCAHSHLLLFFAWDVCVTKRYVVLVVSSYAVVPVAYLSPKSRNFCLYLPHKWRDSIINVRVLMQRFLFFTLKKSCVLMQSFLFFTLQKSCVLMQSFVFFYTSKKLCFDAKFPIFYTLKKLCFDAKFRIFYTSKKLCFDAKFHIFFT
jgi:hypothetical protein